MASFNNSFVLFVNAADRHASAFHQLSFNKQFGIQLLRTKFYIFQSIVAVLFLELVKACAIVFDEYGKFFLV